MDGAGQAGTAGEDIDRIMDIVGREAVVASRVLANAPAEAKNTALMAAAAALRNESKRLIAENRIDMSAGRTKSLTPALLDRLELNEDRIEVMAQGLEAIAALKDPVGEIIAAWDRPSGLKIERVRMPLGVIGVIYE